MLNLIGYQLHTHLDESISSSVYRGIRESDNQAVIIKLLKQESPNSIEFTRYQQEYEILQSLSLNSVVKAYSLEIYQNTIALILEDFGGSSLKLWMNECVETGHRLPIAEFLQIAIQITDAIGNIHDANIIHKDINPSNIVFNPKTKALKIIDFGIATRLTCSNPTVKTPNLLEGTLAYISPEQTGRMNRNLDYRTDFYSLGVTFYELITGQLPFVTQDSMELVHCHIAKQPLFPSQLKPEIPQPISDIIMKLLAKNAEDRYQSAWGIKADLVLCLMQLEANNIIEYIIPGKHDLSDTFEIPQNLYGREPEIQSFLTAFEQFSGQQANQENYHAHIQMMLIVGETGIGKSALIKEVYKLIAEHENHSYLLTGKFDQLESNIPYYALISAFQGLVRQLLTETEDKLQQWREKFLTALGANLQVIIDVIPEIELIVGKQLNIPQLEITERQKRFSFVFQNFIRILGVPEHPLVIFLDNLQWADSATLQLIHLMITEMDMQSLFIIGAYRDTEIFPNHPLIMMLESLQKQGINVNQMTLNSLSIEPIIQLISEAFHRDRESVKSLAELVRQKTGGNPLFVHEYLKKLYQKKLILFNWDCLRWQWNIAQIAAMNIFDTQQLIRVDHLKFEGELGREDKELQPDQQAHNHITNLNLTTGKETPALTETFSTVRSEINMHLATTMTSTERQSSESLDFAAVLKATHAISSEIVLDNLLAKMMSIIIENAGAEKGFFLRKNAGQWIVEVAGVSSHQEVTLRRDIHMCIQEPHLEATPCTFLPNPIINYVARTQETVVLGNAVKEGEFIQDAYIIANQPKSILCTSIQHQGKLLGILYLENNLTTDAFTPERLTVLNLLCSQTAISLENAQLYHKLENYSRTLEEKVKERTQELQQEVWDRKLLAKKLHSSESKIRAVLAAMTDVVLVISTDNNIEIVPTNTSSLQESKFDIISHTIERFFQNKNTENWWQQIQRSIDTQQTINFDYSLPIGDIELWFSANISPLSNDSVIWVARNITDAYRQAMQRKLTEEALRQSEEKFAKAFRSSPCAITLTRLSDGRHIEVNDSFCQFTGYTREEMVGRTAVELNLWVKLETRDQMFRVLTKQGKIHNYEFEFRTKSGEIKTALLSSEVINLYGQDCLISVSQDISYRKLAEAALQKAKEEAEAAKKVADAASLAKSEFLANMSHELRTPLNAILGFSQLINRSANLEPEQRENLNIITRSGEHLLTLINQVLDLSKIEAGRHTLDEHNFDLHRLLDDLEDMFRLRAEDKLLQLLVECSPDVPQYVQTDEVKLRQVLINLLNNAIKFTESGGVSLRIHSAQCKIQNEHYTHVLYFEVEDTGVGIAPEELGSLFESFVQTRSGKASQEGTGLGLAIARQFVQLMGGDITVSSEFGHGSVFKFAIGVSLVNGEDIPTQQPTRRVVALEPNQPRYRILIVDDRWENRQLLFKLLHPLGFEVQEASNGLEALQLWEHWQPHLIWMDMRMPVMDGYEATQRIKATTKGQATAVIALTASTLEEERSIILSAGCDDFVRKPFREADILDSIHKHLGVRYIYDEPIEVQPTHPLSLITPTTVADVPTELLTQLKQAAIRIDMDKIDSLIDEIRAFNVDLAEKLTVLSNDFKYDEILKFIQHNAE